MRRIDLNVDIGEGFPNDEALLEFATSANICCGEHAGSWDLTMKTIELCSSREIRIGMHPGTPHRESMGRKPIELKELAGFEESLKLQAKRFMGAVEPKYIKPHGAWYNELTATEPQDWDVYASCVGLLIGLVIGTGLPVMMLPASQTSRAILHAGYEAGWKNPLILEGFADRAYAPAGNLVPRSKPGAVLEDTEEIRAQVLRLAPVVDSICLHGDTPDCVSLAELVKGTLLDSGYEVAA
ncbi:MAG TPA: LamB/YcsF family protein [Fimbriimonadaceae bacterium]|nr:LamB/YcsF family protein [Fimbriimonadaceae bacterium]